MIVDIVHNQLKIWNMLIQLLIFSLYLISVGIMLYLCHLIITSEKRRGTPHLDNPIANTPIINTQRIKRSSNRGESQ